MIDIDEDTLNEEAKRISDLIGSKTLDPSIKSNQLLPELKKYIYRYHMDLESSERAILLEHGVSENDMVLISSNFKSISDIDLNDKSISVIARITSIYTNQLNDGRQYWKVDIDDGSSPIVLTIWDENIANGLEEGKIYRIIDCYPKEYRGEIGITLGRKGSIIEDLDAKITFNYDPLEAKKIRLSELKVGMTDIIVAGTIRDTWHKLVNGYSGPTTICEGIIDDSGIEVSFSDWANRNFISGNYVFMVGVQVKEFRGALSISLNKKSKVIVKVE